MNTLSLNPGVKTIKVTEEREGQRLDNFLLGLLKGAPRSLIYKIIRDGQVRVNGKREKPEYRLEEDDLVRVPPVKIEVADPNRVPPKAMLERLEASIVFEDKALLVLNKPSGIATHGGSGIAARGLDQPGAHAFIVFEQRFQQMLRRNPLMVHPDRDRLR